jgi:hypothetical protein
MKRVHLMLTLEDSDQWPGQRLRPLLSLMEDITPSLDFIYHSVNTSDSSENNTL